LKQENWIKIWSLFFGAEKIVLNTIKIH